MTQFHLMGWDVGKKKPVVPSFLMFIFDLRRRYILLWFGSNKTTSKLRIKEYIT